MIKIDWERLLLERGFLGFYGFYAPTVEPGSDFRVLWEPDMGQGSHISRIRYHKVKRR